MTDVYQQVVQILTTRFEVEPDEIGPDVTFEELELDSLFMVELALVLQKEFHIKIADEDTTPRTTIAALAGVIEASLARAA
ncbi:acyl carrier protein [Micromonospora echinofusca]|uniref:Acyl carrier protein n=1 Tax=Micromonospora echinofusca TaxID=47858 RepID=A0ABS3VXU1_MICEH|nr:phosphopantetheine-binding protein [Micromonospora echinofusca]MBO4209340.1 acyl carrier protein [Micromonospora echinofusca]